MKYFIDTEFIEGFHKPLFGKRRHFIDLISIGIDAEDGREYYAISNEFNPNDADEWVKKNVIWKLPKKTFNGSNVNEAKLWKSNKQIAQEIIQFVFPSKEETDLGFSDWCKQFSNPQFYGYYCDYDWVLFCSLFERMIDLPKGFPKYCIDLKQTLDEVALETQMECAYVYEKDKLRWDNNLTRIKMLPNYPKQTNEHNALDDARWNKELFEFLNTIKQPA